MMNYSAAWKFLDDLQFFKIKLGLESMTMFLDELGRPQDALRFVHVAGTNGKGSVAVTLLTILAKAGYRVGLYTSPHLSCVRERFRINDRYISEEEFAAEADRIRDILADRKITYFEFTTALAMLWFVRQKVDLAIMEVGMGGRLDATNVITPLVGMITNVSMDHEAYLGNTLAEVAGEKAGIIKQGVPLVSGVGADGDPVPLRVVEERCRRQGAPLHLLGRDFLAEDTGRDWAYWGMECRGHCRVRKKITGLQASLPGRHQRGNMALALACLELLDGHGFEVGEEIIRQTLPTVRWPGRLEYFCRERTNGTPVECGSANGVRYLLDGAHNPAGVVSLRQALTEDFDYRKLILVWGAMADKDIASTLKEIAPLAATILLTSPGGERAATPDFLFMNLEPGYQKRAQAVGSVPAALARAMELAAGDDLICVAGSLYLVGQVRSHLLGEVA